MTLDWPIIQQSFWRDEAFSILLSQKVPSAIIQLSAQDQTPPLYFLLLHFWMGQFGASEQNIRLLSFLFQVGTAMFSFLIARKLLKSSLFSLIIAFVVLLNPFLLQYGFEARPYSMLAFLISAGVYFVLQDWYLVASICFSLSIITHNFGLFDFASVVIWWIIAKRHHLKQNIWQGISLILLPTVTFLGWSSVIFTQLKRVEEGFWITEKSAAIFTHTFEKFIQGDIGYQTQGAVYLCSLILCLLGTSYWIYHREHNQDDKKALLLATVAIVPSVITYLISKFSQPIYHERYLIASAPLAIIFIGYSLWKIFIEKSFLRVLLILCISVYTIVIIKSAWEILHISTKAPINWAVSQIVERAEPGDIILPENQINYLEIKYYLTQHNSWIPLYVYNPSGKIPFYIGGILFDPRAILTTFPHNQRIWEVKENGGYMLITP